VDATKETASDGPIALRPLSHGWVLTCGLLILVALVTRPLLPLDETRYVGAAWEMWERGDFLVPYLNGKPYSHKPPLMFWAIHAGWALFGVSALWARLVSPLIGLATLFATSSLARLLWPDRRDISWIAPQVLIGSLLWTVLATMTLFDLWQAFFSVTGAIGLLLAVRGRAWRGWGLLGLSIGLGILAKGPVILLYTLPPALLAGAWRPSWAEGRPSRWYPGVLAALLLGVAIALTWALSAAASGGEEYAGEILWSQTTKRLSRSPAHQRPLWWYLPLLPLITLPWVLWAPLWRGPWKRLLDRDGWPLRFCVAGCLPAFLVFCCVGAKQPHYLLPLLPFVALLIAQRISAIRRVPRHSLIWAGLVWIGLGAVLLVPPLANALGPGRLSLPPWTANLSPGTGLAVAAAGAFAIAWRPRGPHSLAVVLGSLAPVLILSIHLFGFSALAPAYDLAELSRRISSLERAGVPIAIRKKYQGQFQFLGRLTEPLAEMGPDEVIPWFEEHPEGRFIAIHGFALPPESRPEFLQPYRGGWISIWDQAGLLAHPRLLGR